MGLQSFGHPAAAATYGKWRDYSIGARAEKRHIQAVFARSIPASALPPEILAAFPKTVDYLRGKGAKPPRVPTSIRLSPEVLAHFKAGGPGRQTRIDDALRAVVRKAEAR